MCRHVLLCAKDFKAHIPYCLYGVRDQCSLTTRPGRMREKGGGGRENKMCLSLIKKSKVK